MDRGAAVTGEGRRKIQPEARAEFPAGGPLTSHGAITPGMQFGTLKTSPAVPKRATGFESAFRRFYRLRACVPLFETFLRSSALILVFIPIFVPDKEFLLNSLNDSVE